jgi:F420-dependent oxidoreductase-like protein
MAERPAVYVFTPQGAMSYDLLRERTLLAERLGYDGFWVVDHMWPRGFPDVEFLEGWTTIAGLAEATSSIRLGVLVTCNSYRNPGMLAKTAVTADHVSGGRIELGLGAGWMDEEYHAYGFEFPPVGTRLEQLEESLAIITSLMTNERTSFDGRHYHFRDAPFAPKPVRGRMPITLGGSGTRVFMRLVAKYADRWNCPMPAVPELDAHLDALARHCAALGRNREEIVVSEQLAVVLGRTDVAYREKLEVAKVMIGSSVDLDTMAVHGTPDRIVDALQAKIERGVRDFAVLFGDLGMPETLELFASEVMPKLTLP